VNTDMALAPDVYPWLVADIGGTNARFGVIRGKGAAPTEVEVLRASDFASPEAAALAYLEGVAARDRRMLRPRHAAFALATPVTGDTVKFTNSPWILTRQQVQRALGLEQLHLLNDFEALAWSLPHLASTDLRVFGGGSFDAHLPRAVVGPGTGLGVAACVPSGRTWRPLPSEGGHATLAAGDDFESAVLSAARRRHDHVSAERLLSGIGLPSLLVAVADVRGEHTAELDAAEITRRALTENDALCMATLATFCAMLGSFAGNVALTFGARGGVLVAGGIVEKLGELFYESRFRERFEAKGRFRDYLSAIGTAVITAPYPALNGAAHAIASALHDDAR
jgi:glucokinase